MAATGALSESRRDLLAVQAFLALESASSQQLALYRVLFHL